MEESSRNRRWSVRNRGPTRADIRRRSGSPFARKICQRRGCHRCLRNTNVSGYCPEHYPEHLRAIKNESNKRAYDRKRRLLGKTVRSRGMRRPEANKPAFSG